MLVVFLIDRCAQTKVSHISQAFERERDNYLFTILFLTILIVDMHIIKIIYTYVYI